MQPYRPLPLQIAELIADGRTMIVELDSWYLPDTASTSYREEHVKTSVIAEAIDVAGERLRYFHNASLYELEGEDFRGVFRLDGADPATSCRRTPSSSASTPDRACPGRALRGAALDAVRHHLTEAPATDPFERFGDRLVADLPALLEGDAALYHAYAFATVRMAGAGFELLASHVDWLLGPAGQPASEALARIVEGSKVLGFKLARRRPFDPQPTLPTMAEAWAEAIGALHAAVG